MEPLLPLRKFAETHLTFEPKEEAIAYMSEQIRLRIIIEMATKMEDVGWVMYRHDTLNEQGIDVGCENDKEFAQELLTAIGGFLSPHTRNHLINALQKLNDEWEAERAERSPDIDKIEWCKD